MPVRSFSSGFSRGFGSQLSYGTLCIATKDSNDLEDGDIVHAFNRRDLRQHYAGKICSVKRTPQRAGQLRDSNSLAFKWIEKHSEYKFERLTADTVKRTNLVTLQESVFGPIPNEHGEHINVQKFIAARLLKGLHTIFGEAGSEIWFGGSRELLDSDFDEIWSQIEFETPYRETERLDWPATPAELKMFLWIRTNDFSNTNKDDFLSPMSEADNRKKNTINWRGLYGMSGRISDILDVKKPIDVRAERKHVWQEIVVSK